jgi:probable HAF family extracellular repeat protein
MQDLGTLGGSYSSATDINDSGQVVGWSTTTSGQSHAFLYSDGQMQDLGTLGGYESRATGINDSGQVVGQTDVSSGERHAFLYSGGQMQDLGTLPGDNTSEARGINASGQVVGYSDVGREDRPHAFLYSDGQMQDLGTLNGSDTAANGINDSGQIVGWSYFRAFVYSDGQMQDLNELIPPDSGWLPEEAKAINTSGQIVGTGEINGRQRAFLATPNQAPRVMSTVPAANATAVDPATNVTATFSEEMDASSINSTTFKLSFRKGPNAKEVAASVHYEAATHTATLDPTKSLQKGVSYNAVVTTEAKDLEGNSLEQQHGWSFTVSK